MAEAIPILIYYVLPYDMNTIEPNAWRAHTGKAVVSRVEGETWEDVVWGLCRDIYVPRK